MFVGQGRAGKSSTVKSLLGKEFDANEESTVGVALENCEISRTNGIVGWEERRTGLDNLEMVRAMKQLVVKGADSLAGEALPMRADDKHMPSIKQAGEATQESLGNSTVQTKLS